MLTHIAHKLQKHTATPQYVGTLTKKAYYHYTHDLAMIDDCSTMLFNRHAYHFAQTGFTYYSYYLQSSVPYVLACMQKDIEVIQMHIARGMRAPAYYEVLRLLYEVYTARLALFVLMHEHKNNMRSILDHDLVMQSRKHDNLMALLKAQKELL